MKFSKEQQLNWLAQVEEEIIDSEREIIDPHHHLWTSDRKIGETEIPQYILGDLWKDTGSGHNIVKTCLLYTSPSPRDRQKSRMPSSA